MMYGWWGNGWGGVGWILMCVLMVLFWAAVITAIVLAIRYVGASNHATPGPLSNTPSRPEDVLAERFARGDIDEDEYPRRVALCPNPADHDD